MAEEKKEKWLSWVAVTTIVFAVCATLSTFKGGQFSTRTVIYQQKLANQWAYYQAKDLKSYMHELQKDALELALADREPTPETRAAYQARIKAYDDKVRKYDAQKQDIEKDAREFERVIATTQAHGQSFGMAIIFLQIAILLSSISALMKVITVWYGAMAVGGIGVVYFVNGFVPFF